MSILVKAISSAENISSSAAEELAAELGFSPSQFSTPATAIHLSDGSTIIKIDVGLISCGHSADATYSESLCDLISDFCTIGGRGASLYAEAAYKLGLYAPDGFNEGAEPWRLQAAQYAAVLRVEGGMSPQFEPGEAPTSRRLGDTPDDGVILCFPDGSLYYSDGGRHEVWADSSDFEEQAATSA